MHTNKFIWLVLLFSICTYSQEAIQEVEPPNYIKTIIFKGDNEGDQFPVVKLGEPIYLSFDDISAQEEDYYYKLIHCNYDWTPSNLVKSQYLQGVDNQRILTYQNSYGTLQPYSHYELKLPNSRTKFKLSGNYVLEIYNRFDELMFSRRFVVYKDLVSVGVTIKRSRDFNYINTHQVVQFTINSNNFQIVNPKQEIKIAILQNYHWPTAIFDIAPQFTVGSNLIYRYDNETRFEGGNEYYNVDTKDLRVNTASIGKIELKELYNHYLFTDYARNKDPYTYFPDINGDFLIRTLQGTENRTEAEYTKVHFSLGYNQDIGLQDVYVFGKFNNYALTTENKLTYNESTNTLEGSLLLKQGFYNYKYVLVSPNGEIRYNALGGNHYQTENNYLVLVYYRDFGGQYDNIIGIGSANGETITN